MDFGIKSAIRICLSWWMMIMWILPCYGGNPQATPSYDYYGNEARVIPVSVGTITAVALPGYTPDVPGPRVRKRTFINQTQYKLYMATFAFTSTDVKVAKSSGAFYVVDEATSPGGGKVELCSNATYYIAFDPYHVPIASAPIRVWYEDLR